MDRIEEIRDRLKAATPGPWEWKLYQGKGDSAGFQYAHLESPGKRIISASSSVYPWSESDADLIAHTPDDMAYLLSLCDTWLVSMKDALQTMKRDAQR